jgi:hypothetical protein
MSRTCLPSAGRGRLRRWSGAVLAAVAVMGRLGISAQLPAGARQRLRASLVPSPVPTPSRLPRRTAGAATRGRPHESRLPTLQQNGANSRANLTREV